MSQPNLLELYRTMLRIRAFEEAVLRGFRQGELRGTTHVCLGQEAVAAGAAAALDPADLVTSNHRGHGHMLAKGADLTRMLAELFGRASGYSRGAGGSQHMAAAEVGFLGSNGITGGGLPIAVGAALSLQHQKRKQVVLAFCGDGATAQGTFHEALNLATVWALPVVFLVENNHYAMGTRVTETCPDGNIARRAAGYGIPGVRVEGNDPAAVQEAVARARERATAGDGPSLIEATTYRAAGHSRSDTCGYVPEAERVAWRERDPLRRSREALEEGGVPAAQLDALQAEISADIDRAIAAARAAEPFSPAQYVAAATPNAPDTPPAAAPTIPPGTTYAEAIYLTLSQALETVPETVLLGEDIADYGGAFRVTRDLWERFGPERVRNTPISENTVVGCGVGAAMTGLRPIVEIMFMDFLLLALDQLVNHGAKFHAIYGGQFAMPLTVRTPAGGRRGYGATHSQCFESLLLGFPGLEVHCPTTPQDAADLLWHALFSPRPTVVVEHKLLYATQAPAESAERLPPGRARLWRPGRDLTLVTYSHMTTLAQAAAERLAEAGLEAEVIELRSLAPLDLETVGESACRTQRVLIAEEGHRTGGVGAELAARIQEACFGYLDAPILRVAARDLPIPTAESLERAVLPQVADIVAGAQALLG